jgi:hypothetical protein
MIFSLLRLARVVQYSVPPSGSATTALGLTAAVLFGSLNPYNKNPRHLAATRGLMVELFLF